MRLTLILLATQLAASPILSDGDETTSLQHWYTVSVPQGHGVFEVQVFAPKLPTIFAQQEQVVVLDEALRLLETPEPGTWVYVAQFFVGFAIGWFTWPWLRGVLARRKARQDTLTVRCELCGEVISGEECAVRWMVEEHVCKEIARKALEE